MTHHPAQHPSFVRAEIENWIAWCWAGESPEPREPSRCYSIEGAYPIPDWESEDANDAPPKIIINSERAARVQAIFDRLPQLTRRALMYEYVHRGRYDQWERNEIVAAGRLIYAWTRVDNNRRRRARIDLKISRDRYFECLDEFKIEVFKEFECEVCV